MSLLQARESGEPSNLHRGVGCPTSLDRKTGDDNFFRFFSTSWKATSLYGCPVGLKIFTEELKTWQSFIVQWNPGNRDSQFEAKPSLWRSWMLGSLWHFKIEGSGKVFRLMKNFIDVRKSVGLIGGFEAQRLFISKMVDQKAKDPWSIFKVMKAIWTS